eukprot:scaffold72998_cov65-Phaeocystis_antarctica.AAC.7
MAAAVDAPAVASARDSMFVMPTISTSRRAFSSSSVLASITISPSLACAAAGGDAEGGEEKGDKDDLPREEDEEGHDEECSDGVSSSNASSAASSSGQRSSSSAHSSGASSSSAHSASDRASCAAAARTVPRCSPRPHPVSPVTASGHGHQWAVATDRRTVAGLTRAGRLGLAGGTPPVAGRSRRASGSRQPPSQ